MLRKAGFDPFAMNDYPTSDGRPMAETDWHRDLMLIVIGILKHWYADDPDVYVSGNLLIFYDRGNKRRHISPDCFVVKGVPKGNRPNYLVWEEGKGPDVVIELTSKTTKAEDLRKKPDLYRERLGVREYFLFDPTEDYLHPSLQGFRRVRDEFRPVKLVNGRLPSKVLGLHLERDGRMLRLWNPETGLWLPTAEEREAAAVERAERAEAAVEREAAIQRENERLRQEVEALRQQMSRGK
jgi:Uma2 family endonuclease